jgi:hypothetical protein
MQTAAGIRAAPATASYAAQVRREGGSSQAAVRPFSSRSAIQSLMMD